MPSDELSDANTPSSDEALAWLNDRTGEVISVAVEVDSHSIVSAIGELRHTQVIFGESMAELGLLRTAEDVRGIYHVGSDCVLHVSDLQPLTISEKELRFQLDRSARLVITKDDGIDSLVMRVRRGEWRRHAS